MKKIAVVIFLLNIFVYSPILSHWGDISSIAIRVVQAISIAFGLLNADYSNSVLKKLSIYLFLIFLLNSISEFFHREADVVAILKLLIHCLYIVSLFGILPNISDNIFKKGFLFLLLTNICWFLLYIRDYNPDFSLLKSGSVEGVVSIKSAKGDIVESGFSLASIHVFPLFLFVVMPYLKKRTIVALTFTVSICLLFSLTFTAILASVLAVCSSLILKRANKLSSKAFKCFFFGYAALMLFLYLNDFFDLRTLTTGRSVLWQVAIENIKDSPIFGISLKDFYTMAIHWNAPEISGGSCHNMYLSWLMNHGILSFCVYLNLIDFYWKEISKRKTIYLLPFAYVLIWGTNESSCLIDFSDGIMEFLVDVYLIYNIVRVNGIKRQKEGCCYNS